MSNEKPLIKWHTLENPDPEPVEWVEKEEPTEPSE